MYRPRCSASSAPAFKRHRHECQVSSSRICQSHSLACEWHTVCETSYVGESTRIAAWFLARWPWLSRSSQGGCLVALGVAAAPRGLVGSQPLRFVALSQPTNQSINTVPMERQAGRPSNLVGSGLRAPWLAPIEPTWRSVALDTCERTRANSMVILSSGACLSSIREAQSRQG